MPLVHRRALVRLAPVAVLALVLAACTASDEPPPAPTGSAPGSASAEPDAAATGGGSPAASDGAAPGDAVAVADEEAIRIADAWIEDNPQDTSDLPGDLVVERVVSNMGIAHVQYRQELDGVPVRDAQLTVHVGSAGAVVGSTNALSTAEPASDAAPEVDEAGAVEVATKAVEGEVEGEPEVAGIYLESGTQLELAWQVRVRTREPVANWQVIVDAGTGDVLFVDDAGVDGGGGGRKGADGRSTARGAEVAQAGGCELPEPPSACVFPVDPIFATGDFDLPVDEANSTLEGVQLQGLVDPAAGELVGEYAAVDESVLEDYAVDDGTWGEEGRGTLEFEGAMTYYWVDYSQRLLQDLGFDYHGDDPVELVPRDESEENNAFYLFDEDRIHMGVGTDGLNEAEDAQGILHEYGHALVQAAIPFISSAEGGAFHEGFSDLVAFFTTLEYRRSDPACLFAWVEERECLRRVDGDGTYPDDLVFAPHQDGTLYTGAVYDYFNARLEQEGLAIEQCADRDANPCDAVRDEVYATALGSMGFLTPDLDLDDATTAFAAADLALTGGANAELIAERFGARGFSTSGTETIQMEDLPEDADPGEAADGAAIGLQIEHEYRGDLQVDLRVLDGDGEELCAVEVIAPDSEDDLDNVTGQYTIAGTSCEAFLPPGPDQVWVLDVADTLEEDVGEIVQFVVFDGEDGYPAPGLPQDIPDADPTGISIAVGGDDEGAQDEDLGEVGESQGDITAGLLISHPYVGDLQVQVGVVDVEARELLCSVLVRAADPGDSSADIRGTADVSDCAAFYPPTAQQPWVLRVLDTADADAGTIDAFGLQSVDGSEFVIEGPVDIPDNTGEGATLVIAG